LNDRRIVMSLKKGLLLAIWLLVILPPAFAFQQGDSLQRRYFPKPGDYSVRLFNLTRETRFYLDVPAAIHVNTILFPKPKRLKDWQPSPDKQSETSSLQLKASRIGEAVKIDVVLLSNDPSKSKADGNALTFTTLPEGGVAGEVIGSHFGRLGESITFNELARYGLEPFTVKVVSSNARPGDPSEIINMTSSIEVLSVDKSRGKYLIALRNNSSKNVIGYVTSVNGATATMYAGKNPLIAAWETIDTVAGFTIRQPRIPTLNDDLDEPQDAKVTIVAVVFDDYSYDGDEKSALEIITHFRTNPFSRGLTSF